jgi:hypothetical protein
LIFVHICGHIRRDGGLRRCVFRRNQRIAFWGDQLRFIMSRFCFEQNHSGSSEGHSALNGGIPGRQKLLTA